MSPQALQKLQEAHTYALEEAEFCLATKKYDEVRYWVDRAEAIMGKIVLAQLPKTAARGQKSLEAKAVFKLAAVVRLSRRYYRRRTMPGVRAHCRTLLYLAKRMRMFIGRREFGAAVHTINVRMMG